MLFLRNSYRHVPIPHLPEVPTTFVNCWERDINFLKRSLKRITKSNYTFEALLLFSYNKNTNDFSCTVEYLVLPNKLLCID